MKNLALPMGAGLLLMAVLGGVWLFAQNKAAPLERSGINVADALGGSAEGYARALEVRPFVFPADHGPHPEFRNEWWYFTGNLETSDGRPFGYQFTLFRNALSPEAPDTQHSNWKTNQLYMGHFAVSDLAAEQFYFAERFQRAAVELAGAQVDPVRVWLDDWEILDVSTGEGLQWKVSANHADFAVSLEVREQKPRVLQGNQGLSQKGREAGNASYYYSYTRLEAAGTIRTADGVFAVRGTSWLDREWSTSALEANQEGWDWFALQLSDDTEIMYYQLRRKDGSPDETSKGVFVNQRGQKRDLRYQNVTLRVQDTWTSPHTGATYPSGWTLDIPEAQLSLTITPRMRDQELRTAVAYWEGSVHVEGVREQQPVSGLGYVEMTGYDARLNAQN